MKGIFTLDGIKYEVDSMPTDAKLILDNILQIKEKLRMENLTLNAAINALTKELSAYTEQFTKVEEPAEESTEPVQGEVVQ